MALLAADLRVVGDDFYLIPIALGIGLTALAAFLWSLQNGQYDDLEGAAERILLQEDDVPIRRDAPTVRRQFNR